MVALRPEYAEKLRNPKTVSTRRRVVAVITQLVAGIVSSLFTLLFASYPLMFIFSLIEPMLGIERDGTTQASGNVVIEVLRWLVVFGPQLIPILIFPFIVPFAVSLAGRFWGVSGSFSKTLRASLMVGIPLNLLLFIGATQSLRMAYSGEEIIPALEIAAVVLIALILLPATIASTVAYTRSFTPPVPTPEESL